MRSKSQTSVKVKYKPKKDPICVTEWSSNGVPDTECEIDLTIKTEEEKLQLECRDPLTNVKYSGEQFVPKYSRFAVLEVDPENGKAKLRKCVYFRMKPQISVPDRKSSNLVALTKKEQMDEYNEKFGSKLSVRRMEQRKKFSVSFGEDDYHDAKDQASKVTTKSKSPADSEKANLTNSDIINDTFLLPPRNVNAATVKEVYNIYDIIPETLVDTVKCCQEFENFPASLNSPLVQLFAKRSETDLDIISCIFLDILIKLKSLRSSQLNKAEYMGLAGVSSYELQQFIFKNYTLSSIQDGKVKRTMNDKCKDKIMLHGIILSIHLNHFKPLLISALSQAFQISSVKVRKLGNIVGCHVDVNKTKTERIFIFSLPLYSMEDSSKYKRRRIK